MKGAVKRDYKVLLVIICSLVCGWSIASGSLIYTYDFPGNPGSGLASDQTNPQPSGATFSDFTRNNIGVAPSSMDEFGSNNWSQAGSLDSTVFESFSIAADIGFHLNLSSLVFDARMSATGPANMEVDLFLNGSASAYATFAFSPATTTSSYTFNFGPLTDLDNVTLAAFKFFGWNATGAGGQLYLDNVGTNGEISSVPEATSFLPVILVLVCAIAEARRRMQRKSQSGA